MWKSAYPQCGYLNGISPTFSQYSNGRKHSIENAGRLLKEIHRNLRSVIHNSLPEREDYMRFEELIEWERAEAAEQATQIATQKAAQNTKIQDILELLEDHGEVPDALTEKLRQSGDEALKRYHKLAAKADSIEAFMKML